MANSTPTTRFRLWLWLIRVIGVIVPRRLRADWRQEWEAELQYRERLLAEWDKLNWRTKLDLFWWFRAVGRLKPGVALEQARAELDTVFQSYLNENFISTAEGRRDYHARIELPPASKGLDTLAPLRPSGAAACLDRAVRRDVL